MIARVCDRCCTARELKNIREVTLPYAEQSRTISVCVWCAKDLIWATATTLHPPYISIDDGQYEQYIAFLQSLPNNGRECAPKAAVWEDFDAVLPFVTSDIAEKFLSIKKLEKNRKRFALRIE